MKRSGPIARRTPLVSRSGLARTGSLVRSTPLPRAAVRARRTPVVEVGAWQVLRLAVLARAGGRCDHCGLLLGDVWECHHRKLRSRGGRDDMTNLVALHLSCHELAHGNPAWAEERGLIVASHADPAGVPVLRHGRARQLPTPGGWIAADLTTGDAA